MAVDYMLKIDGIEGESKQTGLENQIEVMSWSWGENNGGSAAGGGGQGAGKVNMQDFNFTMQMCKASPKIVKACATGDHIKEVLLTCRRAGKEARPYLEIKFTDCLISSYQTSGAAGSSEIPTDNVSLNFSKIEFKYSPQKEDGTLGTAIPVGYDLKAGKAS
jgi:type VI secretion system secreted protein Hcp